MLKQMLVYVALMGLLATRLHAQDSSKLQDTPQLLSLIPSNAIALLHCNEPRQLVQHWQGYIQRLDLLKFDEVKELLQSTPYQRFYRFLAFLEKEYARSWEQLLSDLSGNSVALALVPGTDPKQPQALGVVIARDQNLLSKIYTSGLEVLKQEPSNLDGNVKVTSSAHRGVTVTAIGDQFYLAQHQFTLLMASRLPSIKQAIDQLLDRKESSILQHPRFVANERPASADVLLWGWLDLAYVKKLAKEDLEKIKLPTNDLLPQLLFGGLFDAFMRSDHAWLVLRHDVQGPRLEITTPTGRASSQEGARFLHMHDPGQESILPLLKPTGTVYSNSFFWDLSALWEHRGKIYKEGALKEFEEGDKTVKPFLAGNTLGNLFSTLGARHRIVVARQRNSGYTIKPKSPYPAFAWVVECKDADKFNKIIAIPLRTAGLFFSTQVSMKLFEESHSDCKVVGYRFNEIEKNRAYDQGTLFNYSPSFARVGNFFIISSTRELCIDLIDEMKRHSSMPATNSNADMLHQFSWSALGDALAAERPRIATELTLRHGGNMDRVDDQISALLKLLDRLGTLDISISHSPGFKLEIRTQYK